MKYAENRRLFTTLFLLGFSSGLPLCLIGTTLQAWFSMSSMSVLAVSLLGLIGQPYLYRFLWAPWMDRFSIGQQERRRGWIFLLQCLLTIGLFGLSFIDPEQHPVRIIILAVIIAICSASQDTVIDAYRVEILPENERGIGTAIAVAGYRLALLIAGSLALVMAQYMGWELTYQCMSGFMLIGIIGNYFAPRLAKIPAATIEKITPLRAVKSLFNQTMYDKPISLWILFIFLYKIGEAFTSTTSTFTMPFFIQGLHFDLATIGLVNKMGGLVAAITGGIIAGVLMLRLSLFRALFIFGVMQSLSVLLFVALTIVGHSLPLFMAAVVMDNFVAGLATTALLALMMGLCDQRFTATHFAFLSAVAMLPKILAGPIGGLIQYYTDWQTLYLGVFFCTWPSLLMLLFFKIGFFKTGKSNERRSSWLPL